MSAPRSMTTFLLRTSRPSIPCSARSIRSFPPSRLQRFRTPRKPQVRPYSQASGSSKIYAFEDVKKFIEKPSANRILVDTREPAELQSTGTIPGSVNIPIKSQPDSFFITPEEFEDRFGFDRPQKGQEVVFYCKSGVRSRSAAEMARQAGWEKVAEYQGSWSDWEKNGGEKEQIGGAMGGIH